MVNEFAFFLVRLITGAVIDTFLFSSQRRSVPRGFSIADLLKSAIAFPLAVALIIALVKAVEYLGSHIHVPLDFGIAILLTLFGIFIAIPAVFFFIFLLIFRGLGEIEKYLKDGFKQRQIQHQFALAKSLIRAHQYEKAQAVLSTINEPKARQWEAKLRPLIPRDPDFLRQLQ